MWSLVIPIIFNVIKTVESGIKGHKRGAAKKKIALDMVKAVLHGLVVEGDIPAAPTSEEVSSEIDRVHYSLSLDDDLLPAGRVVLTVGELTNLIKAAKGT